MALDGFVYCDCYEKGNLRSNPPNGVNVVVTETGEISCETSDEDLWLKFSAWKRAKACLHTGMILVHLRLGKVAAIDALRAELQKEARDFPILLQNVVYSGTHTCDWIPVSKLPALAEEVKRLKPEAVSPGAADSVRLFKIKMAELIIAAQHVGKPICF